MTPTGIGGRGELVSVNPLVLLVSTNANRNQLAAQDNGNALFRFASGSLTMGACECLIFS
jgi:hypothetical protein